MAERPLTELRPDRGGQEDDMAELLVKPTELPGVKVIVPPTVFRDHRGVYVETYNEELYRRAGVAARPLARGQCTAWSVKVRRRFAARSRKLHGKWPHST